MASKKYDIVVFGATGFTGQYTVDEVARAAAEENFSWAIAGRKMEKLQKVLSEASSRTGMNLEEVPIIIADTSSNESLEEMAKEAKIVLNCVGPYRFYGEVVVKACIENGAHHLDISGEPQFLEKMQLLYDGKAKSNNVFIIGTTGFDSIPAETGIEFTRQQFKEGRLTNIDSFTWADSGPKGMAINTGTFDSAVHGVAHWGELTNLRKSLYPDPMPKYDYKLPKNSSLFFSKDVNKWCLPFLGSDKSVFYRTNRELLSSGKWEKPIEFRPYTCFKSIFFALGVMVFGVFFLLMSSFSLGRSLLLKYPHIFTAGYFRKGGPTREQIENTTFTMTFVGHGYKNQESVEKGGKPDKKVVTKITAPEPGYVTTPICMVQCAVTILKEQSAMEKSNKGGVLTPGAAFYETSLIDRLSKHSINYSVVSDDSK